MNIFFYELHCDVELKNVSGWGIDMPTACFNDSSHTISDARMIHSIDDDGRSKLEPNNFTFSQNKARKFNAIDARTTELISTGFTYATKQFSLSTNSQARLMGSHQKKDTMTYPIAWNTIDDLDVYSVADAADLTGLYDAATNAYRVHIDSGTALKDSIRAAVDEAALALVVDTR